MEPIRLKIEGLAASGSLETVENMLRTVPGVLSVRADPAGMEVRIDTAGSVDPDALIAAVQEAGCLATLVA